MDTDDLRAWLRLSLTPGVGNDMARQLLAVFGSPQAVFDASAASLRELGSERLVEAIGTEPPTLAPLLQTTEQWLAAGRDRAVLTLGEVGYPAALLQVEDPPLLLYALGSLVPGWLAGEGADLDCVAVVGSRNPTPQGELNARQFAKALAGAGLCVVSGLALGIDGAAHDGALLGGGQTIAIVGTGLDRVYPKRHLALAHRIAQHGALLSEFALGSPPLAHHFPRRNRIISGLSRGTLVVEAALQSGSLITARMAAEQGKDVFAIPGSIHSLQSRGCHWLINQGARLVESAQDVLDELGLAAPEGALRPPASSSAEAQEGKAHPLLAALGYDAVSLDALQARIGWPTDQLLAELLTLELDGQVVRLPGGGFQRIAQG
jgi:DNA processing protein